MNAQRTSKRKDEGQRLNDCQRMEIINLFDKSKPPSMRSVARQFGVDEKVIRKIKSRKDGIRERAQRVDQVTQETTFRDSQAMFPEVEKKLFEWIDAGRRASLALPPSMICHKAKQIATELEIDDDKFKASWGWFARFRHRYGLNGKNLFGEGGQVDKNNPETLKALEELSVLIGQYDPECVYNMDETGLFFRIVPCYTVLMPHEDLATVRGKKKAKDRVTLVVCCNATGSERVPITMIGKAKEPACIAGNSWPIPYFNQKNAWIDVPTFNKWFDEVFEPYVRRRTGHKVLLILDNAPGHASAFERNGIRVAFFPPNVTSWKQPMDMGIIAALKKRYRYLLLKDIIAYHDNSPAIKDRLVTAALKLKRGAAGVAFGRPAHLLDAANFANIAWNEISADSLKNCFKKADIIPGFNNVVHTDCDVEDTVNDLTRLLSSCDLLGDCNDIDVRNEIEQCLYDDKDESQMYKDALLEDMDNILNDFASEPTVESEEDENESVHIAPAADQLDVIAQSLEDVMKLEIDLGGLVRSHYLSSEQINQAKGALFTLRRVLQNGRSAIARERIENSRQMTIFDFC